MTLDELVLRVEALERRDGDHVEVANRELAGRAALAVQVQKLYDRIERLENEAVRKGHYMTARWRAYLKHDGDGTASLFLVRDDGKPALVAPLIFHEREEGFSFADDEATISFDGYEDLDFLRVMADLARREGIRDR